jgi:hypothetical protein
MFTLMSAGCALPVGEDYSIPRNQELGNLFINDYNLETYVSLPILGERPVFQVNTRGDLDVDVLWKKDGVEIIQGDEDAFEAKKVYMAEITLTPKNNHRFYPDQVFNYPGDKVALISDDQGSPTRTVTVTYKPPQATPGSGIEVTF